MLKLVLKYLKGSACICACIAPLMMFVEVLMDLQQPVLMSRIIDIGVANGDQHYVIVTGVKMIAVAVIGLIGGAGCGVFGTIASVTMSSELRHALFKKIQSLSFMEINHLQPSSLITRLTNDVLQMQLMLGMMLRTMVRAPIICVGGIVMSFLLSPRLSLVFCLILPLVFCATAVIMKKSVPLFSLVQVRLDRMNTVMRENLLGIRVIKSFSIENRQHDRFTEANDELMLKGIKAQNMTLLLMPVVTLVMNLSVVSILWFGGRMAIVKSIEIGKIMAVINYLVQITYAFTMFVNLIINISRAQASSKRIVEVFALEPSIQETAHPVIAQDYGVEFRNVSFRYDSGGDYVLKNLSFSIRQGEILGIIGATGSGKSSLIGLIPRLYDPTEGQVLMGGRDIRGLSLAEVRRITGVVAQDSTLFSGTVMGNLQFGNDKATFEEMEAACSDAQALDFLSELPEYLKSPVEQRARNFSGGQKQRLSIARTLLKQPKILILDDSTSAVDLKTEANLRMALVRRKRRQSLILVAQRVCAIMEADKILVLDNGEIAAMGTHAELLRKSEIYRSIAVSQLGEEALSDVYH